MASMIESSKIFILASTPKEFDRMVDKILGKYLKIEFILSNDPIANYPDYTSSTISSSHR